MKKRMIGLFLTLGLSLPALAAEVGGAKLDDKLSLGGQELLFNVLRHLTADQLVDALVEGLQANNTPEEAAAVKAQTDQLVATMKAFNEVREKDIVALDFVGGEMKVSLNGEARGGIAGERFNKALLRVWLGDKPVQSDLKKALLGG